MNLIEGGRTPLSRFDVFNSESAGNWPRLKCSLCGVIQVARQPDTFDLRDSSRQLDSVRFAFCKCSRSEDSDVSQLRRFKRVFVVTKITGQSDNEMVSNRASHSCFKMIASGNPRRVILE